MHYLFVYGTLRKGFDNHNRYLKDAEFVGYALTHFNSKLYGNGIPYLKKVPENSYVVGEIYRITDEQLKDIDRLEGHPSHYYREKGNFYLCELDETVEAYFYNFPHKVCGKSYLDYTQHRTQRMY